MEKIKSLGDLYTALTERCYPSEGSLSWLVEALKEVKREDLLPLVQDYTTQYEITYSRFSSSARMYMYLKY